MSCSKCACKKFIWNPVSAAQKFISGSKLEVKAEKGGINGTLKTEGLPKQDNKSDQVAYRNCLCGHHYNYHEKK